MTLPTPGVTPANWGDQLNDHIDAIEARLGVSALHGTGQDGVVTISVNTTLTRDMYYESLTVNSGIRLTADGYRVFVRGLLTLNGTISHNGVAATNVLGGGLGGGSPTTTNGGNGTSESSIGNYHGGAGGAGGTGPGGSAGSGGTLAIWGEISGGSRTLAGMPQALTGRIITGSNIVGGGAGGGAGAGSGTQAGGPGGAGGGVCMVVAARLAGTGTIEAKGQAGSNTANNNSGGGGGGGGGVVVLVSTTLTNPYTLDVSGGTGGTGAGTGGAGVAGSAGRTFTHLGV